ncbi:GatB/YqeY domain-containing protein [Vagococcus bubulae]|uniref:GatB/YqeY domain-containing protein n=1 Tax=Vagococcus bubulae TaxID=1977868 RepID=UPI0022DF0232|nr:GatB/YqeY domain-containing protein [Vagococcus bubulae]
MTEEYNIDNVVNEIDQFKQENINKLESSINHEIEIFKTNLPEDINKNELESTIQKEVDSKLAEFSNEMDLKPKALYYALKSEAELNDDITEKQLTNSAYDFLERNTQSKFLKKILKELKKESKNE